VRITLSVLVLLIASVPSFADAIPHLRGVSPTDAALIRELLDGSPTARALANELDSTDLIVYVQLTASEPAGRAATRLVTATSTYRFLRLVIGATTHPRDRAVLLGHELQHAVEIGRAPDVRDIAGLRRLYRRIGEDRHARFAFETSAAREMGFRVRRELQDGPKPNVIAAEPVASGRVTVPASSDETTGSGVADDDSGSAHLRPAADAMTPQVPLHPSRIRLAPFSFYDPTATAMLAAEGAPRCTGSLGLVSGSFRSR
jgi:hypothetical protein